MSNMQINYKSVPGFAVAKAKLNPPSIELSGMMEFMQNLQDKSEQTNKQFWGQEGGMAHLHQLKEFNWLTVEVEKVVARYLSDLGYDVNRIALFHQKSWPVITRKNKSIDRHSHNNSILAAVFYLQCDQDSGGDLFFHMNKPSLPNIPKIISRELEFPTLLTKISPHAFDLVVFPSNLDHSVSRYNAENPRWSISYDISVTAAERLGSGNTENVMIHPKYWREFSRP